MESIPLHLSPHTEDELMEARKKAVLMTKVLPIKYTNTTDPKRNYRISKIDHKWKIISECVYSSLETATIAHYELMFSWDSYDPSNEVDLDTPWRTHICHWENYVEGLPELVFSPDDIPQIPPPAPAKKAARKTTTRKTK